MPWRTPFFWPAQTAVSQPLDVVTTTFKTVEASSHSTLVKAPQESQHTPSLKGPEASPPATSVETLEASPHVTPEAPSQATLVETLEASLPPWQFSMILNRTHDLIPECLTPEMVQYMKARQIALPKPPVTDMPLRRPLCP